MKHNATIIEALFGIILLLVLFVAVRAFLSAKQEALGGPASSSSMVEIEEALKKILEKANQVPAAVAGGEGADQNLLEEIARLKAELESKKKNIEELAAKSAAVTEQTGKADPAAAAVAGISTDEKKQLEDQIKELQAKLSEYEIISEDIADLSFYKEQNARLQKELEAAKSGAVASVPAVTQADSPVVDSPPVQEIPESSKPNPTDPVSPESTAAKSEEAEAPVVEAPVENVVDQELMAEFAAAVQKQNQTTAVETEADLGSLNMDKMLAEAAEIKTDVADIKPEDVLSQSMDENKLLQEAAAMKSDDANAEDKKLMGQFENFVKKGE